MELFKTRRGTKIKQYGAIGEEFKQKSQTWKDDEQREQDRLDTLKAAEKAAKEVEKAKKKAASKEKRAAAKLEKKRKEEERKKDDNEDEEEGVVAKRRRSNRLLSKDKPGGTWCGR